MVTYKIYFKRADGKIAPLHNSAANAAVSTFTKVDDVLNEVRALLYSGSEIITIEGKEKLS